MAQEIFQSLSGSEIHAVFGNIKFADIQMIKYASSRQKAPVYTMGSADLRAIARGPRSINGALIFSHLSKQNLVQKMGEAGYKVFLSNDETANYNGAYNKKDGAAGVDGDANTLKRQALKRQALKASGTIANYGAVSPTGLSSDAAVQFDPFAVGSDIYSMANFGSIQSAFLADQLPPFDITLVGIPETAAAGLADGSYKPQSLVLRGVEFVSEASGTSIEDLVIEKQMSFLARSLQDWAGVDF